MKVLGKSSEKKQMLKLKGESPINIVLRRELFQGIFKEEVHILKKHSFRNLK